MPFVILVLIALAADTYLYLMAKKRCRSIVPSRIQLITALASYALLIIALVLPMRTGGGAILRTKMWLIFSFITILFPKILFVLCDSVALVPTRFDHKRWRWLSLTGGVLAVVAFAAMWWGALINRYTINVKEVDVEIANLPKAFDGYRIVQISDLHVGTYGDDSRFVNTLVNEVNQLEPDLIVFTGDIVNRNTDEILPFVESLSQLYAPDGIVSILGNHDYGDYYDWESEEKKRQSLSRLIDIQRNMGWNLLLNDHVEINRDGNTLVVIGVENIGDPPFKVYGDLKASYPDLGDDKTKILLTHNPAHWDKEVANKDSVNIALTLSGHTHAMQMEVCGLSPAALRYKHWGGLYEDEYATHRLYVNIGVGTVGIPMRLGATPEITLITLHK